VGTHPLTAAGLRAALGGGAAEAAPVLLGCIVTANGVTVRLVEVEAYAGVGEDPGSHAHRGRTARNDAMFGAAGTAYVYFTYGMHWCVNVVCGEVGVASAVLLRAGEVIEGRALARQRRCGAPDRDLARGPARLAQALGLDKAANGTDLLSGSGPALLSCALPGPVPAGLPATGSEQSAPSSQFSSRPLSRRSSRPREEPEESPDRILSGPRTGVAGAGALTPWRFWLADDPAVSPYRRAVRRVRRVP
jgi:DNA-3-methyladenine glycosylase